MTRQDTNNPRPEPSAKAYESEDVRLRGIIALVIGFAAFAAILFPGIWFVMKGLAADAGKADQAQSAVPLASPPDSGPPLQPTPLHDTTPSQDLAAMRTAETSVFLHSGWTRGSRPDELIPPPQLLRTLQQQRQPTTQQGAVP